MFLTSADGVTVAGVDALATKVARDWLANELYEPSRRGKIDAACRDRKAADLITAAGASAPADAVFGGRFATGEDAVFRRPHAMWYLLFAKDRPPSAASLVQHATTLRAPH